MHSDEEWAGLYHNCKLHDPRGIGYGRVGPKCSVIITVILFKIDMKHRLDKADTNLNFRTQAPPPQGS
jgi:hypothetical protein